MAIILLIFGTAQFSLICSEAQAGDPKPTEKQPKIFNRGWDRHIPPKKKVTIGGPDGLTPEETKAIIADVDSILARKSKIISSHGLTSDEDPLPPAKPGKNIGAATEAYYCLVGARFNPGNIDALNKSKRVKRSHYEGLGEQDRAFEPLVILPEDDERTPVLVYPASNAPEASNLEIIPIETGVGGLENDPNQNIVALPPLILEYPESKFSSPIDALAVAIQKIDLYDLLGSVEANKKLIPIAAFAVAAFSYAKSAAVTAAKTAVRVAKFTGNFTIIAVPIDIANKQLNGKDLECRFYPEPQVYECRLE